MCLHVAQGLAAQLALRHPLEPVVAELACMLCGGAAADELFRSPGLELDRVGACRSGRVDLAPGELNVAVVGDAGLGHDEHVPAGKEAHRKCSASFLLIEICVRSIASTVAPPRCGRMIKFSCVRA